MKIQCNATSPNITITPLGPVGFQKTVSYGCRQGFNLTLTSHQQTLSTVVANCSAPSANATEALGELIPSPENYFCQPTVTVSVDKPTPESNASSGSITSAFAAVCAIAAILFIILAAILGRALVKTRRKKVNLRQQVIVSEFENQLKDNFSERAPTFSSTECIYSEAQGARASILEKRAESACQDIQEGGGIYSLAREPAVRSSAQETAIYSLAGEPAVCPRDDAGKKPGGCGDEQAIEKSATTQEAADSKQGLNYVQVDFVERKKQEAATLPRMSNDSKKGKLQKPHTLQSNDEGAAKDKTKLDDQAGCQGELYSTVILANKTNRQDGSFRKSVKEPRTSKGAAGFPDQTVEPFKTEKGRGSSEQKDSKEAHGESKLPKVLKIGEDDKEDLRMQLYTPVVLSNKKNRRRQAEEETNGQEVFEIQAKEDAELTVNEDLAW